MKNLDRVIVWRITQKCNMNCLFCSYSNEVARQRDIANKDDVYKFIGVLGEYKNKTNQEILISWIGGEPFLYDGIWNLSKELKTKYGFQISTTTNGLLLNTPQKRKNVIDHFTEIVFSIDGFRSCNDRIRKLDGHFDAVTGTISSLNDERKLYNSEIKIKVNTILLWENIDNFEEFCYILARIGVDELTFNQLGGYDRPEFYDENRLLIDQVKNFILKLPEIKKKALEFGLVIHGSEEYLNRITCSTENKKISIDECYPAKWFWFINENGYISPCSYTSYEYKLHINEIQSAKNIGMVEKYFTDLRKTNRSKWCDNCHCTQLYNKFK